MLFFETADPMGVELIIPDCCEDIEVVPQKSYYGGKEGNGEHTWYRAKSKLQRWELIDLSDDCEDAFVCGRSL